VTGFTELSLKRDNNMISDTFTIRANSYFKGGPWYDFAMVDFAFANVDDHDHQSDELQEYTCAGVILGIFRYHVPGSATPYLVDECHHSPLAIHEKRTRDNSLFVAVHASDDWLSYTTIQDEFVQSFNLGDPDKLVYLLRADHIVAPLVVFPDVGGPLSKYHAILPTRHWPGYFSAFVDNVHAAHLGEVRRKKKSTRHRKNDRQRNHRKHGRAANKSSRE
jgi:hypothetical protein